MTYITWDALKDTPFLPWGLGGNGDIHRWHEGLPTWPRTKAFDIIFVSSAGFFIQDIVELLVRKK